MNIFRNLFTSKASRKAAALQRDRAIGRALEHGLCTVTGMPPLHGHYPSLEDARTAINANMVHCGPVSQEAEEHLRELGIEDVKKHSLQGHYVLQDAQTGKLHDLECYAGCFRQDELPRWRRDKGLNAGRADRANATITDYYAHAWLEQRNALLGSDDEDVASAA